MLDALDTTLELLLKRELPPNVPSADTEVFISFDTPFQGAIKQKPAINFFLYDVQENLDLRSSAWSVERQSDGKAVRKRPPARVDCSYLITAWSQDEDDIRTEHQLLGEVMKVLLRYRKIPEAFVGDELDEQHIPLRLISLRPSNLQSFGEFWQAMGGKDGTRPKVVLHCTVTIAVAVDEVGEEAGLVGVYQSNSR
jgi:Pvc16 N-terminal domain